MDGIIGFGQLSQAVSPDASDVPFKLDLLAAQLTGISPSILADPNIILPHGSLPSSCPSCKTTVHSFQNFCVYCGAPQGVKSIATNSQTLKGLKSNKANVKSNVVVDKDCGLLPRYVLCQESPHCGPDYINQLGEVARQPFYNSFFDDFDDDDNDDVIQNCVGEEFDNESFPFGDQISSGAVPCERAPTTLMIRNIPVMYTQDALVLEWPNNGSYDFFYMPYSCSLQRNLTYAFINFTSHEAAMEFKDKWEKNRLPHFTSRKPLNISCADVQGRDENLWQLKKKRIWRLKVKQCQPLVFDLGEQISLSEAFRRLSMADRTWST